MITDVVAAWDGFRDTLKMYGNVVTLLNPPCSVAEIVLFEQRFNLTLPLALKSLLALNNGQRVEKREGRSGLFKSISGWDNYEKYVFLPLEEIGSAYQTFVDDGILVEEFGFGEIPFAVDETTRGYSPRNYRQAYCINSATGAVSLIYTSCWDPWLPPAWQLMKHERGKSLTEFIEKQIEYYR